MPNLEVPDLRRSVDGTCDDVSSVGRQLDAVDAYLFSRQHDVSDRSALSGVQLHIAHLKRRR